MALSWRQTTSTNVGLIDELHKYSKWKGLLKGFFDSYGGRVRLIITGALASTFSGGAETA